jgi:patatin-like phospholipase/acyl hydrolase
VTSGVIVQFFDDWMDKVFHRRWYRALNPFVSKYPDDGLNEALQALLGNALMGDAKKPLFVTAVDVGGKTLKVFSSLDFDDSRLPMWDVVRRATAAETYFPSWKGYADGGVFANNPAMVAVAAAVRVMKVPVGDMEVLSIGTGRSPNGGQANPKSLLQWGEWLVPALLNGAAEDMHDYFVRSLPLRNYVRVQFLRDAEWRMDSPEDMDEAMVKWGPDIAANVPVVRGF